MEHKIHFEELFVSNCFQHLVAVNAGIGLLVKLVKVVAISDSEPGSPELLRNTAMTVESEAFFH